MSIQTHYFVIKRTIWNKRTIANPAVSVIQSGYCNVEGKMTKTELIHKVSEDCGLSQKDVGSCLNSIIETIQKELQNDGEVMLPGFGSFSVAIRSARQARNFKTGEMIDVPETKTVKFKVGKTLKEAVK